MTCRRRVDHRVADKGLLHHILLLPGSYLVRVWLSVFMTSPFVLPFASTKLHDSPFTQQRVVPLPQYEVREQISTQGLGKMRAIVDCSPICNG